MADSHHLGIMKATNRRPPLHVEPPPAIKGGALRRRLKAVARLVFCLPRYCPISFGIKWRLGQLAGFNRHVPWPVHFTSTIRTPRRVKLGAGTFPGDSPNCYIQGLNGIEVGDFVNLGPGVGLISANHDPLNNERWIKAPPIRLGRHCWLGMNAIVLPGVTLGDFTIVGAGSVVTRSFEEGYCVIAGNPARAIRTFSPEGVRQESPPRD